jgi:hypothetical protein
VRIGEVEVRSGRTLSGDAGLGIENHSADFMELAEVLIAETDVQCQIGKQFEFILHVTSTPGKLREPCCGMVKDGLVTA